MKYVGSLKFKFYYLFSCNRTIKYYLNIEYIPETPLAAATTSYLRVNHTHNQYPRITKNRYYYPFIKNSWEPNQIQLYS